MSKKKQRRHAQQDGEQEQQDLLPNPFAGLHEVWLNADQVGAALTGLINELLDLKRYLSGTPENAEPSDTEKCCPTHLRRYEEARRERQVLLARKASAEAAIRVLEESRAEGPSPFSDSIPRALAECLADRETPEAAAGAEWLLEHEGGDEVWDLVGPLLDKIEELAK